MMPGEAAGREAANRVKYSCLLHKVDMDELREIPGLRQLAILQTE
jgi:hypothetical protein